MKLYIILITLSFFAGGCIKSITPNEIALDADTDIEELKNECGRIESEGRLSKLLQEIKESHFEILYLIGLPDPTREELKINELAKTIKVAGEKISNLVGPEWTTSKWEQSISWKMDENDFRPSLGTYVPHGFSIKDASIHSVYWMGEENNFLKSKLSIIQNGNSLEVIFKGLLSSLDLCQLQDSLVIIVQVNFRNIRWSRKQYFNLSVHNEFERNL